MNTYGWSGGVDPLSFTSALDGGEWSAARPWRFTHWKRPLPLRHQLDRWLGGLQSQSGRSGEENKLHCRESNPRQSAHRRIYPFAKQGVFCRPSRLWEWVVRC
jgi:hypothetical protein